MRFARMVGFVAVLAAVAVSAAAAFGFTDDSRTLPSGTAGSPYRAQLRARNGCPPYSFRLSGASVLPPGLSVAADGLIAGTPITPGRSEFWLAVHDACGGDSQRQFSITVYARPPSVEVGVPFTARLSATGAPDDQNTWSLASGTLPPGLTLDPSGTIAGTPTSAGSFPLDLAVFNPHHVSEPLPSLELTLVISAKPIVVSTRLPDAHVGSAYRTTLVSRGGTDPMTWNVVPGSGKLPPGIRLNARIGALIGLARKPGTYRFAVALTDRFRQSSTRRLVLAVHTAL